MRHLILLPLMALVCAAPAQAQWPTTVRDNLPVSILQGVNEMYPRTLPMVDNRTLVVFGRGDFGVAYQIINPDGSFLFPQPPPVFPSVTMIGVPDVVPDAQGRAYVGAFDDDTFGQRVQRIDSQGNLRWGPGGVIATDSTGDNGGFSICSDSQGGVFVA
ncbi:MAG: hypothetical protein C4524_08635, partial [Candidatus Zixiibacteriota bacterium]